MLLTYFASSNINRFVEIPSRERPIKIIRNSLRSRLITFFPPLVTLPPFTINVCFGRSGLFVGLRMVTHTWGRGGGRGEIFSMTKPVKRQDVYAATTAAESAEKGYS